MSYPGDFINSYKCPCCNNPWSGLPSNMYASTSTSNLSVVCKPCSEDDKGYSGIDPNNIDTTISPKENFYLFSNGKWIQNNPIPNGYANWNTFTSLRDLNLERLKIILDDLSALNGNNQIDYQKLADFHASFMDEDLIEKLDIEPITEVLDFILSFDGRNITPLVADLHFKYGVNVLFKLYSAPDKKNSNLNIANITQGGLGLPDRDYYFDADKEDKVTAYIEYISKIFQCLGSHDKYSNIYGNINICTKIARQIYEFEKSLAKSHLNRSLSRDQQLTFNKMSLKELQLLTNDADAITWSAYLARGVYGHNEKIFDWENYFDIVRQDVSKNIDLGEINVCMVENIKCLSQLVHNDIILHYSIFHSVHQYAPHLSKKYVDLHFDFNEKTLQGIDEIKPRWKRSLANIELALGDAMGKLYVEKYFPSEYKHKVVTILEEIREIFRCRLHEIKWMSSATRQEALEKLSKFGVKIGYPDKWIEYDNLVVKKDDHMCNMFRSHRFLFSIDMRRINQPVDKSRWFMTPQTVNAYYHPSINEIVFPAAILQAPFFDNLADPAVNYGSFGAVIGHEMTHGFDDQGRKFDSNGVMRDWWTKDDGEEYEKRTKVMIEQAELFEVHGIKLKGKLTCGENIADLGGLKLAIRGLKAHCDKLTLKNEVYPVINGFTPFQRFFLAWSQVWRENCKKERAIQLVTLDPHGPNEFRCNGPLSNMPEFHEAFNVVAGDPMWKDESQRVDIW